MKAPKPMLLIYIWAIALPLCFIPHPASCSNWDDAKKVIIGKDVDKQLTLISKLSNMDPSEVPDEIQTLLIVNYIEDYRHYYKNPSILTKIFNGNLLRDKKKYVIESKDVIDSFYQPQLLVSLVLGRGPSARLSKTYSKEIVPVLVKNIKILISDPSLYNGLCAALRELLLEESQKKEVLINANEREVLMKFLREKLLTLEKQKYPCKYPEHPESIILVLKEYGDLVGRDIGDALIQKCICNAPSLFDQIAHIEIAYQADLLLSKRYRNLISKATESREVSKVISTIFKELEDNNNVNTSGITRELWENLQKEKAISCDRGE